MKELFLKGKGIYLRLHQKEDLSAWFAWFNDPEVTRFLEKGYFPNTKSLQAQRLKSMYDSQQDLQLAVVEIKSKRLAGTVGLHQINLYNRNADISVVIGEKKFWGKSYGKEAVRLMIAHAFNKLNLHKVTAGMVESNKASFELFTELGFVREANLKEQLYINGHYQSLIKLGLLKSQWMKNG